jgi:hypothetical protein
MTISTSIYPEPYHMHFMQTQSYAKMLDFHCRVHIPKPNNTPNFIQNQPSSSVSLQLALHLGIEIIHLVLEILSLAPSTIDLFVLAV